MQDINIEHEIADLLLLGDQLIETIGSADHEALSDLVSQRDTACQQLFASHTQLALMPYQINLQRLLGQDQEISRRIKSYQQLLSTKMQQMQTHRRVTQAYTQSE